MLFKKVFILIFFIGLTGTILFGQTERLLPGQLARQSRSGGTIYRCLFDHTSDAEIVDGWPDYWIRKTGIDKGVSFPAYLEIGNVESQNNFGGNALRINIEGGAAAVFSPKIPIRTGMSYTVSAYVKTAGLMYDDVFITLLFYKEKIGEPVQTVVSEKVRNTKGWQRLHAGPIVADMTDVHSVAVGLMVIPTGRQDYGAVVEFTNVEIRESPSVALSMPNENHIFFHPRNIDVGCRILGVDPALHVVSFTLEDPFGQVIAKRDVEMMIGNQPASQFVVTEKDRSSIFQGVALWHGLPIISPGFYRIRVSTPESFIKNMKLPEGVYFDDPLLDAEPLTFVVMPPSSVVPGGDFGWNLEGWSLQEIESRLPILTHSGISRIKISAWLPPEAVKEQQTLTKLCDILSQRQFQVIGLLQPVPPNIRKHIKFGNINAAAVFSLPADVWSDSLQPTLQNLSLLVRDWQWTSDGDSSITEIPRFEQIFENLRRSFDRNNLGFGVGFAWNWEQALPEQFGTSPTASNVTNPALPVSTPPVQSQSAFKTDSEFVALTSADPIPAEDFAQYLAGTASSRVRRFISLIPLAEWEYSLESRINDLVRRMVLGKIGAEALFLTKPIDGQNGILRQNITPGELFLPWRTTATQLSGRLFLGSVSLPNRSRNYHFDCGNGKAVMVVWNDQATMDKPIFETLYLGTEPEILDVWGKHFPPEYNDREQMIPVTPFPLFVTDLSSSIARFRLNFQLGVKEIPSVTNQKNLVTFTIKNDTILPVTAQIMPVSPRPDHWRIDPPIQSLTLEAGATEQGTFNLSLTARADTDLQPIKINIKTQGPDPQEFSIYDKIQIGSEDVYMKFSSQLNRNGDIEVSQSFINNTNNLYTYSCQLNVPTRTIQEKTVRQGFGRSEHVYIIRRGRELVASGVTEMTVRARPVGTVQPVGQPMHYTIPLLSD